MATSVETFFAHQHLRDQGSRRGSPGSSFSPGYSPNQQPEHHQEESFSVAYQRSRPRSQQGHPSMAPPRSGELQPRFDVPLPGFNSPQERRLPRADGTLQQQHQQHQYQQHPALFAPGASRFMPNALPAPAQQMPSYQGAYQSGARGSSCRYTSWTGQEHRALDALDCIEDDYEEDDVDDLEASAATLRKLTMPSANIEASGLANPFSWKELERSCRKLDEAHIRIEEIDLTCCEDEEDTPTGSKVLYNFRLESCPEEAADSRRAEDKPTLHLQPECKGSPANSSSGISIGGSSTTMSSLSGRTGSSEMKVPVSLGATTTPAPSSLSQSAASGDWAATAIAEPSAELSSKPGASTDTTVPTPVVSHGVARSMVSQGVAPPARRMSSLMKTVKEKCGLLFTSSGRRKRAPQI